MEEVAVPCFSFEREKGCLDGLKERLEPLGRVFEEPPMPRCRVFIGLDAPAWPRSPVSWKVRLLQVDWR